MSYNQNYNFNPNQYGGAPNPNGVHPYQNPQYQPQAIYPNPIQAKEKNPVPWIVAWILCMSISLFALKIGPSSYDVPEEVITKYIIVSIALFALFFLASQVIICVARAVCKIKAIKIAFWVDIGLVLVGIFILLSFVAGLLACTLVTKEGCDWFVTSSPCQGIS